MREAIIPRATYRLQFNRQFTLDDARAMVPYLDALGISHVYASPLLCARPGSLHGYDIVDHSRLNPEVGTLEDLKDLIRELRRRGMGLILDIVPNHMGVHGQDNPWWQDVLRHGPASRYADHFDIDWSGLGRLLLPILGDHYGRILENGELTLDVDAKAGDLAVGYYEHRFPLDPATWPAILEPCLATVTQARGTTDSVVSELRSLITATANLPDRNLTDPATRHQRHQQSDQIRHRLSVLLRENPGVRGTLDEVIGSFNGTPGRPDTFDALHGLLEKQTYRPAYWRVAADEINYRRFFDINDLAGLRVEQRDVFLDTHSLILELAAIPGVDGLRIDHPDGLFDPRSYLRRLEAAVLRCRKRSPDLDQPPRRPFLAVEKILGEDEILPADWPVAGTTGYDFLVDVERHLVDPDGLERIRGIYRGFTGRETRPAALLHDCRRLVIRQLLSGELSSLAREIKAIAEADRRTRDFTLNGLRDALTTFVACFPVYRSYMDASGAHPEDRRFVDAAALDAKRLSPAADAGIFDFIRSILLVSPEDDSDGHKRRFTMRFQQYTGPVMAKALEDTSLYLHHPLASLNEVGAPVGAGALSPADFQKRNLQRRRNWPHAMLASSTHDNKRSEDVRSRISILSEIPGEWESAITRWREINHPAKSLVDEGIAPCANDEYLLYQTLVGTWPLEPLGKAALQTYRERIQAYMVKALREGKRHSSWINPNEAYEAAMSGFIHHLLSPTGDNRFLADFLPFQRRVARFGLYKSLARILLKHTAPGFPDTYQGNEAWDFSLVDPDNRHPVNFEHLRGLLAELEAESESAQEQQHLARELAENPADPRTKLFLTRQLLACRREHPDLFREGDYRPLSVTGPRAEQVTAFAHCLGDAAVIAIAPRYPALAIGGSDGPPTGADVWQDTGLEIPRGWDGPWTNLVTREPLQAEGGVVPLTRALADFPVALLKRG